MQTSNTRENLIKLLADLDEDAVLRLVDQRVGAGDDPYQIIEDCNEGMRLVGQRYEQGQYFISGLIMSGEILTEVVERVGPLLNGQKAKKSSGSILLGTVSGDIHDIGKNIAGMLLSCYGFTVTDLGVDVPPAEFTAKALEMKPDIIGLSGLITASFEMMQKTVTALRAAAQTHGLKFHIIIGGATVDEQVCRFVGADEWVTDAMVGVRLCQKFVESSKQ